MATLTAIPRDSNKGVAGVECAWLANWTDLTVVPDSSTAGYATFTADVSLNTLFTKVVFSKDSADFGSPVTGSAPNATTFYTHTLNMVFARMDVAKRNLVKALGSSECLAIVKSNQGEYWLLGDNYRGLDLTTGDGLKSGVAFGDQHGSLATLSASFRYPPFGVAASTMTDASLA
jgi:hypothetical protein